MGVKITELLPLHEIDIKNLEGKVIAIDASLFLYQFLTTIRQRDGTPLVDSKGRITSHLTGIFSRSTRLMQHGLKLIFVFDGTPPKLKQHERERRKELKKEAELRYTKAVEERDIESMKKYAARTTRLTPEMINESKELIQALGLPIIQAPSEAEAQASYLVKKGDAFAVATNDADALLFGAPKLIRNLSIFGKRKKTNRLAYETVKPELVDLAETLNTLGIDQDKLIAMCMLVGTDYNVGGVKGIGPKNALKLVKQHKDLDKLFEDVQWDSQFDFSWTEVFYLIKKMPITDNYSLKWRDISQDKIKRLLVDEHNFSSDRVNSQIERLLKEKESKKQRGLGEFF
jgi:flap endonuclease-1